MTHLHIVEDESALSEVFKRFLEREGYTVHTFETGTAFLEAFEQDPPDAVVLDIGLPDLDGWAVRQRLNDLRGGREVPVVAVTGYGGAGLQETAESTLGFARYLEKPVPLDLLLTALEHVLRPPTDPAS